MSALFESKIDATHRLERDGRWETASRYRHRRRQELRDGGMSKSDAREAAWDEMTERFQPIDAKWRRMFLFAGRIPSTFVPRALEWRFRCAWAGICQIIAFVGSQDEQLSSACNLEDSIEARAQLEVQPPPLTGISSDDTLDELLRIYQTGEILDHLETELTFVRDEIICGDVDSEPGVLATQREISAIFEIMPQLRESAPRYWPKQD
jgi:hypothetical protein